MRREVSIILHDSGSFDFEEDQLTDDFKGDLEVSYHLVSLELRYKFL